MENASNVPKKSESELSPKQEIEDVKAEIKKEDEKDPLIDLFYSEVLTRFRIALKLKQSNKN